MIAHWIEQAGINTVVIGLIKPHLEQIQPPRALWVPFELGRPLGPPGNPKLQREVLQQALSLVETAEQPILEEFKTEDPRATASSKWVAPSIETVTTVAEESAALKSYYQQQCVSQSRTSVGVAKTPIKELADLFDRVFQENELTTLREEISPRLMLRLAFDDLKSYYVEAALANNKQPSSMQIYDWMWHDTLLGKQMRELRHRFMASDDEKLVDLGTKFIVPHRWRD